jgi:tetratricopeptide (TPR) repeat protein
MALALVALAGRVAADEFEDSPPPVEEKTPRNERQRNHIEALSLFGAGRIEEQKDHPAAALRLYERALRFEPDALPIVREIIPLAFSLDRPNEAVRYALRAAELDPSDPLLLRQLGLHLAESGRFQQALKLYQQAQKRLVDQPRSAAYVMLSMELGRLCFVTDHQREAAAAFADVLPAIDKPADFGLNEKQAKMFSGDEGAKTLELFAEAFLAADRPDDASRAYEKLEQLRPNKPLHAYHLARVSARKKEPAKAIEQLQAYFDEHGVAAKQEPYTLLATVLTDLGQQDKIVERLEAIATAEPKNRDVRHALARAALEADQSDKAEAIYKELLKAAAAEDVYQGLITIYRQRSDWAQLIKVLGDTAIESDLLELLDEQVKDLVKDAKAVAALLDTARREFEKDPDRLDYGDRMAMALLALEAREFDAASEFFNLALKVKREDAAGLFEAWGVGLILAEQYDAAAGVFRRAIDERVLPAGNTAFHHYLSGALEMAGKTDEAVAAAREALAMPDAPPRMYSRLGWVLYHAKRYPEAEKAYRDFLAKYDAEYESEELRTLLRDARLVLSNICAIRNDSAQAEELLEQVLDEYPENVGALNDLGYLWVEQNKNLERAVEMIREAVEGDPDNEAYRDSLGWAYYQMGRYADAVEELKKAVAAGGEEPDGVILDHLGDAYDKLGEADKARETWQRAIQLLDKDQEPDKVAKVRGKLEKGDKSN